MADEKTVKAKIKVEFEEAETNAPLKSGSTINQLFGQTQKNLNDLKDAEKNTIVGIQKNGEDVAIDSTTRKVDIEVPTTISELTDGVIDTYVGSSKETTINSASIYFSTGNGNKFKFEGQAIDFVNSGGTPQINGVDIATKNDVKSYSNMTGATASVAGKAGLVPAPTAGEEGKFLKGDGTWGDPTDTTYSIGVSSNNATNGNAGIKLTPSSGTAKTVTIKGTGGTTVTTDGNGVIVVNSPATGSSGSSAADDIISADSAEAVRINGKSMWFSTSGGGKFKMEGVNFTTTPQVNGTDIATKSDLPTYSNMTAATASAAGKAGLVPAPAAGKQNSYLKGDGTWAVPTGTTYSNFVKSGSTAKAGLVPAPPTTEGTTKYLREDGTWAKPSIYPLQYDDTDNSAIMHVANLTFSTSSPNALKMSKVNFKDTPQVNGVDLATTAEATTTKAGLMSSTDKTTISNLASTYISAKSSQTFTDDQKKQARTNIGAIGVTDYIKAFYVADDGFTLSGKSITFSTSSPNLMKMSAVNFVNTPKVNGTPLVAESNLEGLVADSSDGLAIVMNNNGTARTNTPATITDKISEPYVSLWYSSTKIAVMRFMSHVGWFDNGVICIK